MGNPRLRVRNSGYGSSGYVLPARVGDEFKIVKNADGDPIKARLDEHGRTTVYPGVTTVLDASEAPGVKQFAVDQTAAYAVANIDALLNRTEQQGFGFLRWFHKREPDFDSPDLDIRTWHSGVLNDLANLGTWTHDYIEADAQGHFTDSPVNEPQAEMVEQWHIWRSEHTLAPRAVEVTVFNEDEGYAGTLDFIATIDDETFLLDAKTSRKTNDNHCAQVAALDNTTHQYVEGDGGFWVEAEIPSYDGYGFLHLRPNDYDNKGEFIPAFCRLERIPHREMPIHLAVFRGALARKKAERELQLFRKRDSVAVNDKEKA